MPSRARRCLLPLPRRQISEPDDRRDDRDDIFLALQSVEITGERATEQGTLTEIQRCRAGCPLELEWSIGARGVRIELTHNLAREIVGYAEPIAAIAVR